MKKQRAVSALAVLALGTGLMAAPQPASAQLQVNVRMTPPQPVENKAEGVATLSSNIRDPRELQDVEVTADSIRVGATTLYVPVGAALALLGLGLLGGGIALAVGISQQNGGQAASSR